MTRLLQVTASRYISSDLKYQLLEINNLYYLFKNGRISHNGVPFNGPNDAQAYINNPEDDSIQFILSLFNEDIAVSETDSGLEVQVNDKTRTVNSPDELLSYLIQELGDPFGDATSFVVRAGKTARDIANNMVRVKSSNLWSYGIDIKRAGDKAGTVVIQFKGKNGGPGDIYMYYDVPISVWQKMLSAPSKGHAFWKLIRNNYAYRKLTGDKRGKLPNAVN